MITERKNSLLEFLFHDSVMKLKSTNCSFVPTRKSNTSYSILKFCSRMTISIHKSCSQGELRSKVPRSKRTATSLSYEATLTVLWLSSNCVYASDILYDLRSPPVYGSDTVWCVVYGASALSFYVMNCQCTLLTYEPHLCI